LQWTRSQIHFPDFYNFFYAPFLQINPHNLHIFSPIHTLKFESFTFNPLKGFDLAWVPLFAYGFWLSFNLCFQFNECKWVIWNQQWRLKMFHKNNHKSLTKTTTELVCDIPWSL
jgi:hypothetical protein